MLIFRRIRPNEYRFSREINCRDSAPGTPCANGIHAVGTTSGPTVGQFDTEDRVRHADFDGAGCVSSVAEILIPAPQKMRFDVALSGRP